MDLERVLKGRDIVQISLASFYSMSEWSQNNWNLVYEFNPIIENGAITVMDGDKCASAVLFNVNIELSQVDFTLYRVYEGSHDYKLMHQFVVDFSEPNKQVIKCNAPDYDNDLWHGLVLSIFEEMGLERPKGKNAFYRRILREEVEKSEYSAVAIYMALMAYIVHYKDNQEICEVERTRHSYNKNRKGKGKSKKTIVISSATYRIKYVDTSSVTKEKRDIERHTEAWKVRGHWRHLQNGKTVWVREHVKGNKEAKIDHKIYDIQCNKHFYEGEDK